MKIAVSSENGNHITGYADQCSNFLLYELSPNQTIRQSLVTLSPSQTLKNLSERLSLHPQHPLHGIDAFVTQSLAENLKNKLGADGIKVVQTSEQAPLNVINGLELTLK